MAIPFQCPFARSRGCLRSRAGQRCAGRQWLPASSEQAPFHCHAGANAQAGPAWRRAWPQFLPILCKSCFAPCPSLPWRSPWHACTSGVPGPASPRRYGRQPAAQGPKATCPAPGTALARERVRAPFERRSGKSRQPSVPLAATMSAVDRTLPCPRHPPMACGRRSPHPPRSPRKCCAVFSAPRMRRRRRPPQSVPAWRLLEKDWSHPRQERHHG